MFTNILVPTDGSKLSQKAVQQAMQLAKLSGGKLIALHVYPKFSGSPYGTFGLYSGEEHLGFGLVPVHVCFRKDVFREKLASAAGVALDTALVQNNDVYAQIIAVAKKRKCDLICIASHGRRGLAGVVLGSETHKVLTHSTIPVLVLR